MVSLIIDTSTRTLFLALYKGRRNIYTLSAEENDISSIIVDYIDKALKLNGLTIKDLTDIFLGVGPGSFTGLRIGVTVGKMLTYDTNITLHTINSLYLYGSKLTNANIMLNARNGLCYGMVIKKYQIVESGFYRIERFLKGKRGKIVDLPDPSLKVSIKRVLDNSTVVTDYYFEPDYQKVPDVLVEVKKESSINLPYEGLEELTKDISSSLNIYDLYCDSVTVGELVYTISEDSINLISLYVTPANRNRRYGTMLIEELQKNTQSPIKYIQVETKDNLYIDLLSKVGFTKTKTNVYQWEVK